MELERSIATGEEMLEAARAADWERVRALQPARERQLKVVFDKLPTEGGLSPLMSQVQRLMVQNRELVQLALDERDEHGERLGVLRTGERARKAYADSRS